MTSVFHKLWTLAVGKPDYVKADWLALDNELARLRRGQPKVFENTMTVKELCESNRVEYKKIALHAILRNRGDDRASQSPTYLGALALDCGMIADAMVREDIQNADDNEQPYGKSEAEDA